MLMLLAAIQKPMSHPIENYRIVQVSKVNSMTGSNGSMEIVKFVKFDVLGIPIEVTVSSEHHCFQ